LARPSSGSVRSFTAGLCGALGVLLFLVGSFAALGTRAVFNADFFADRVADSLADSRTSSYVAEKITDAVVAANADLILVRPLVKTSAQTVVSSAPFRTVVREGVKQSHVLLATEGGRAVLLSVSDFGLILRQALADHPELAAKIPEDAVAVLGRLDGGPLLEASADILRTGQRLGQRPRLIGYLGILLLIIAVLLAAERELALLRAGIAVTATAGIILLVYELGVLVVVRLPDDPALGQALAGVWSTFVAGFRIRVMVVAGIGLLMTAAATAFLEVMKLEAIRRSLQRFLGGAHANPWVRLLRGLTLVLVGCLTVIATETALRILTGVVGAVVAFLGLRELCRLAVDPAARLARQVERLESRDRRGSRWLGRTLTAAAVAVLLVPGVIVLTHTPDEKPLPAAASQACNGLEELCDRPLDQVVFACTHNAMGAADVPGWMFPNQQYGIRRQLEDGIRALMLDVLPGIPVKGAVKTDLEDSEFSREKLETVLGAEGLDAALRIRERLLGARQEDREPYLCHALCEIGAQRLVPVLGQIRDFLADNPREIILLIIEDSVPAADIADAFVESGLVELVYRGPVAAPWPTLGEMAAAGERVVVLGENDTEGVDWYHPAWEVVQETRYDFKSAEEFDCLPNRGGTSGSLLLVNHWVNTPPTSLPSDAARVNARGPLLDRIEDCRRERGRLPNIIAVDFYGVGDLLEVVDELNREDRD
jgi:hypothetical protein